jgi:hypothetical protein
MAEYSDLLRRLRNFIYDESENQRLQLERQLSLPLGERVAKGFAIEGLHLVSIE